MGSIYSSSKAVTVTLNPKAILHPFTRHLEIMIEGAIFGVIYEALVTCICALMVFQGQPWLVRWMAANPRCTQVLYWGVRSLKIVDAYLMSACALTCAAVIDSNLAPRE
jgi:hypothetical protein